MDTVVNRFKECAPEAIHHSKLRKEGCRLLKDKLPRPNVIIDLDKIETADDSKRADFLFASDDSGGWIISIEMKKGAPNVQKSVEQLQAATNIAEEWTSVVDVQNFRAILVSGSLPKAQRTLLRKRSSMVRFGDRNHFIDRLTCGDALRKALH